MTAFWSLAVVGVVVRWAVYVGAGFGQFQDPFTAKTILYSLTPIAGGGAAFLILTRIKLPAVPPGDVVNCFSWLGKFSQKIVSFAAQIDFGLRRWTAAAGILVVAVLLITALIHLCGD